MATMMAWMTALGAVLLALPSQAQPLPDNAGTTPRQQPPAAPTFTLTASDTFYRVSTRSNYLSLDNLDKVSPRSYEDLFSLELYLAQHQAWSLHVGPSVEMSKFGRKGELSPGQALDLTLGSQLGATSQLNERLALSADFLQMQYRLQESGPQAVQFIPLHDEQRLLATLSYTF